MVQVPGGGGHSGKGAPLREVPGGGVVEVGVQLELHVRAEVKVELLVGLEVGSTTPSTWCRGAGASSTVAVPFRLLVLPPTMVMLRSGVGPSTLYLVGGGGGGGGAPRGAGGEGGGGGGEGGGEGGGRRDSRAAVTSSGSRSTSVAEVEGLELGSCSRPLELASVPVGAVLSSG